MDLELWQSPIPACPLQPLVHGQGLHCHHGPPASHRQAALRSHHCHHLHRLCDRSRTRHLHHHQYLSGRFCRHLCRHAHPLHHQTGQLLLHLQRQGHFRLHLEACQPSADARTCGNRQAIGREDHGKVLVPGLRGLSSVGKHMSRNRKGMHKLARRLLQPGYHVHHLLHQRVLRHIVLAASARLMSAPRCVITSYAASVAVHRRRGRGVRITCGQQAQVSGCQTNRFRQSELWRLVFACCAAVHSRRLFVVQWDSSRRYNSRRNLIARLSFCISPTH